MGSNSLQLTHDHSDVLNSFRYLDLKQFLNCQNISELVVHRGEVIHSVNIGDYLRVGHCLTVLLEASVQISDMGLCL